MKTLKGLIFTFFCVLVMCSLTLDAQTVNTSLNPEIRDISELYIGFNRRSDNGTWYSDNSFFNLVDEMNPDIVRYPGGTQANYWDWSTGQFIPNTDKVWGNKEVVTIPSFLNAMPTQTKVVYVVNMARPTPATGIDVNASEAILKSTTTLNAKITNMLNAIGEFITNGVTPFAVELGNEFYFGNIESGIFEVVENNGNYYSGWDTANSQPFVSSSKPDAIEVSARFYLEQSKAIVSAIKAVYPNMKVVLTTTKGGYAARESWNNTIVNELENNPSFASLQSNTYALTQHHYLNDSYGLQTVISDNASSVIAISEGIQYPIDKQVDYDFVPSDYKIWYTEYGEVKQIAEETWASAVRYTALIYSWINRGDKVGQLGFHYISDNNVVKADNPMVLAPVGMAQKLVALASKDMSNLQIINFSPNPISTGTVNALYGFKYSSNEKETLLLLNTSDLDFSNVSISNLFSFSGQATMTQYYSNAPYVSPVFDGHANIVSNIANVSNSVAINKFSITVVEVPNPSLGIEDNASETIKIYPNPVSNYLSIDSKKNILSVELFDIKGAILKNRLINGQSIDMTDLSSGIYVIKVETIEGVTIKKIIKE